MAKRKKSKRPHQKSNRQQSRSRKIAGIAKSRDIIRRRAISDARLKRGLQIFSDTKDFEAAANAIRVSPERFKRAALRKKAIRKRGRTWLLTNQLRRKMPMFSGGEQYVITATSKTASLIGRYMSAVRRFLRTNDPSGLVEFKNRGVKSVGGRMLFFETDPNALYRLSSAGTEPFEDVYRIVL